MNAADDVRRYFETAADVLGLSTNMRTLLDDGILKALKGVTTLEEVLSTCHAEVLLSTD